MNETSTLRNERSSRPMARSLGIYETKKNQTLSFRSPLRSTWALKASRLWIALGVSLLLEACGSSGDSAIRTNSTGAGKPTAQSVQSLSTADCKDKPLVGQWRVTAPFADVITLNDSCLFQSYVCDTMGYVNSDISTEIGIASITIVYTGSTDPRCPPPGDYKCGYDARQKFYQDLEISCK